MPNLTVSLDEEVLRAAKIHAAARGTSISKIVRDHLREVTGLESLPATSGDPLVLFSRDELGRREAMAALGVDYGTLLRRMQERGLPLPVLAPKELEAMVQAFERVMAATD